MIKFNFKKLNLSVKVIGTAALSMITIILVLSIIAYWKASSSLMDQAARELQSSQVYYTNSLMRFIDGVKVNLNSISENYFTKSMVNELIKYHKRTNLSSTGNYPIDERVQGIHRKYEHAFDIYTSSEGYGFSDILIICARHGHVMYTKRKNADLGANLASGKLNSSNLAELWEKVNKNLGFAVVDMKPYAPRKNMPAMFAGIPIFDKEKKMTAVAVLCLNNNKISEIFTEGAGIGTKGETYLVGPDKLMRSDSSLDFENHSLNASFSNPSVGKCDTEPVRLAFNNQIATKESINYLEKEVLAFFSLVNIGDFNWAIISEIDLAEVWGPIISLRNYLIILSIIMMILATAGLIYIIKTMVLRPLEQLNQVSRSVALGDFTKFVTFRSEDEMGNMAESFNAFVENVSGMITNVIIGTKNLTQAIAQITSSNQNLSQRTTEQAASLEEIVSTIEETTAIINQNADNAENANRKSLETSTIAKNGQTIVTEAVKSINEINKSSKKIAEINSMINEISFQTNLLALNAAVEAARAGEQGKGFAVVAGEVRNLAQRSAVAAKEISSLIQTSIEKIDAGTQLVNRSGEALERIISSVVDVGSLINEIAAASQEQKQGIEQINHAIGEMDTTTQENAALVEETATASEEMASQSEELLAMVELFKVRPNTRESVLITDEEIYETRLEQDFDDDIDTDTEIQEDEDILDEGEDEGFEEEDKEEDKNNFDDF